MARDKESAKPRITEDSDASEKMDGDDAKIVKDAKRDFRYAEKHESASRVLNTDDLKFVHGDSDNNWQWPDGIYNSRTGGDSKRPCLTINKTKQHANQVINDAKQNKISISIHPTGDEATYEAAQCFEGLIRQIEYQSRASIAYDKATEFQTYSGKGYLRVTADYVGNDTFDQDLAIKGCNNPLSIYMDPDAKEADKSDSRFAFEFDDMAKHLFNAKHPEFKDKVANAPLGAAGDDWLTEDHVRVVRYWRRTEKRDKLVHLIDPQTQAESFVKRSEIKPDIWAMIKDSKPKMRDIISDEVEWFLIGADEIIDRGSWPGIYIPIVPVIWEETFIEGQYDCKGLVRALKDAQRTYNYGTSAAVEHIALQSKIPYIGPMEAFEGYTQYWENANNQNYAWMPYNHAREDGTPIPAPSRQPAPSAAPGYEALMQSAQNELMMASGQYQAQMGENENAKSGKAISARQRQGDRATYQGIDGLATAVRQVGRILIDLIPHYYDTKRVKNILAEDGERGLVQIDPTQQQAIQKAENIEDNSAAMIFNPNVGKYSVQSDVGPDYATRREEAFNAFSQIMAGDHDLVHIAGDLMFKNMDVPGADELAERMRRMVPPQALGQGPSQQDQEMQGQMANLQKVLSHMAQQLADKDMKLKAKDQQKDIDFEDAVTRRITALGNSGPAISKEQIQPLIHQVLNESLGTNLDVVPQASAGVLAGDAQSADPAMPPAAAPQQPQMQP